MHLSQALQKVKTEKPDLITLDYGNARQRGDHVLCGPEKGKETKEIPVIVISGIGPRPPTLKADIPTVSKPIDRELLLKLVAEKLAS